MERSIQTLVNRHDSLRIRISHFDRDTPPTQIVDPQKTFHLRFLDLSKSPPAGREEIARTLATEFISEDVDLKVGPAFDASLLRLSEHEHVLILVADHIISDGTSYPILTQEVLSSLSLPQKIAPPLTLQFPDYAVWHHKSAKLWQELHHPYWHAKLSRLHKLTLPTDHSTYGPSGTVKIPFGKRLTAELRRIAREELCPTALIFLSLYLIIMAKWCDRSELLVNFISHGRHDRPELKSMIGCIAYPIFLRIEIDVNKPFRELVRRVAAELSSSITHDPSHLFVIPEDLTEIPFNWLPSEWRPSGTIPSAANDVKQGELNLAIRRFPLERPGLAKFYATFMDTPSGVVAVLLYNTELFLKSTVEQLAAQISQLAKGIAREPSIPIGSYSLLVTT